MRADGSRAPYPLKKEPNGTIVKETSLLIIDDNPGEVALLRRAVERAGVRCQVTVIENGSDALAFIRGQGKHALLAAPDLAILDLHLPLHDGVDVLQAIRESRTLSDLPVAVLSSSPVPGDKEKLEELGITAYIEKPSDLKGFLNIGFVVKDLLGQSTGVPSPLKN
ncbi:MAG TPA: response regulator [Bryobacteraceae bacterium]|jgi:CheY-like chemotaxis protein|nr:response regulator [Bryobacteraceae bacterium]